MADRDIASWQGGRTPSSYSTDPFNSLRRQMDQLFDSFFSPMEPRSFAPSAATTVWPRVDLHESELAYRVTAELPGLDQKDIDIRLHDNALTISGEKRDERREEDGRRTYAERSYGRFERTIPFAEEVDADKVRAGFSSGLLTIDLPKNPKAAEKSRRIDIQAG